jgi:hypothetical protein
MKIAKTIAMYMCLGCVLVSLLGCKEDFYLDPDKYVGTWTLEEGTELKTLTLTEDTWVYVRGEEHSTNQGPVFVFDQGGKGTFEITEKTLNLTVDEIWTCTTSTYCGWFAKGSPEYNTQIFLEQETVPYVITDTTLSVDLGSGFEDYTRP